MGDPTSVSIQSLGDRENFSDDALFKDLKKEIDTKKQETVPKPKLQSKNSSLIQEVNDPLTPKYEIVYKNSFDMSEYTYSSYTASNRSKPSEIVLRIHLPQIESAAGVDLDVSENFLKMECNEPVKYKLSIHLAYSVFSDKVSAKFEKKTKTLKVSLSVIPDPVEKVEYQPLITEEEPEKEVEPKVEMVCEIHNVSEEKTVEVVKISETHTKQTSSFVRQTPDEVDVAVSDLKPVLMEEQSTKVVVKEGTQKKSVSFAPVEPPKPLVTSSEFKNKYLFDLD